MRVVIDLQGAQGSNRLRGIGRFSRELVFALAREPRGHEIVVALNGTLPDGMEELTERLRDMLPDNAIHIWHAVPGAPEVIGPRPFRRAASEVLRAEALRTLRPDVLLVSSLFGGADDDFVSRWPAHIARTATAVVCYDLIPLIYRADYLDGPWRDTGVRDWYFRCLHELSLADGLLAISEATQVDVMAHLGTKPDAITNILAGIEPGFRPVPLRLEERAALVARYGLKEGFILFVGGGDPRKNESGLIQAYALLPPLLRERHQLTIVGQADQSALRQTARRLGLQRDSLALIRFVEEADLAPLYSACALFVMPSFYEGFGLPAAEAMACGAPTIGSAAGSLPEVIGMDEALFDPGDPADIARIMERGLVDAEFRARLTAHGLAQAGRFTWSMTAARTWDFLEARFAAPPARQMTGRLPRLALTSPLPPESTGIADYTRELAPALARHYDVVLISPKGSTDDEWLKANFRVLTPKAALEEASGFNRVLHQLGNSDFHGFQFDGLVAALPGTATLHDSYLSGYALWRAMAAGPDHFARVLHTEHGWPAVAFLRSMGWRTAAFAYPCSGSMIAASLGVIQHSEHAGEILRQHGLHPGEGRWRRIPLVRRLLALPPREAARRRLGIGQGVLVIATFGSLAARKRPDLLARAWRRLCGTYPGTMLALVGEAVRDDETDMMLAGDLKQRPGEALLLTGRTTPAAYRDWLAAADIAVQLRVDSRGETSAALADCLGAALPVVVNHQGADIEIPGDVVISVPSDAGETELMATLADLAANHTRRRALGMRARDWVRSHLAPLDVADAYHDAIETFHADPALRAIAGLPLLAAPLPPGEVDDFAAVARTLAATYPPPRPPHLFLDTSGWSRHPRQAEAARNVLLGHPPSVRVEAVVFENGIWRTAPERAAKALGLRLQVSRQTLMPAVEDVLLLGSAAEDADAPAIRALPSLRRQGLRVIVPEARGTTSAMTVFDGLAGRLAGGAGPTIAFPGRVLPDWLEADRFFRQEPAG